MGAWRCITNDQWVLQTVSQGHALSFRDSPPLAHKPVETPLPVARPRREALWIEVQSLLDKGAIARQGVGGWGVYSHYFLATKKTGGFHPILNLRGLNTYLLMEKFRMGMRVSILQNLQPGMWMVSLDLKDAYLHVPIVPSHRRFLRFVLKDSRGVLHIYQWVVA